MVKYGNSEKVEGSGLFSAGLVITGGVVVFALIGAIGSITQGDSQMLLIALPGIGVLLLLVGFFQQVINHLKMMRAQLLDMEGDLDKLAARASRLEKEDRN